MDRDRLELIYNGNIDRCDVNCHGAIVYVFGFTDAAIWIDGSYLEFILAKHFKKPKRISVGSVFIMKGKDGILIHSAIYLGKNKWFHKRGKLSAEIESKKNIIDYYSNGNEEITISYYSLKT